MCTVSFNLKRRATSATKSGKQEEEEETAIAAFGFRTMDGMTDGWIDRRES